MRKQKESKIKAFLKCVEFAALAVVTYATSWIALLNKPVCFYEPVPIVIAVEFLACWAALLNKLYGAYKWFKGE